MKAKEWEEKMERNSLNPGEKKRLDSVKELSEEGDLIEREEELQKIEVEEKDGGNE